MAKARLALDTRKHSRSRVMGLYPVTLCVHHNRPRTIRTGHYTSIPGWDGKSRGLKKSVACNRNLDCDAINAQLGEKLYLAKKVIFDMGSVSTKSM